MQALTSAQLLVFSSFEVGLTWLKLSVWILPLSSPLFSGSGLPPRDVRRWASDWQLSWCSIRVGLVLLLMRELSIWQFCSFLKNVDEMEWAYTKHFDESLLKSLLSFIERKTLRKKIIAERGFDPRTSGLWAQHASTAPLCYIAHAQLTESIRRAQWLTTVWLVHKGFIYHHTCTPIWWLNSEDVNVHCTMYSSVRLECPRIISVLFNEIFLLKPAAVMQLHILISCSYYEN